MQQIIDVMEYCFVEIIKIVYLLNNDFQTYFFVFIIYFS